MRNTKNYSIKYEETTTPRTKQMVLLYISAVM